jgi:hypothetical protein
MHGSGRPLMPKRDMIYKTNEEFTKPTIKKVNIRKMTNFANISEKTQKRLHINHPINPTSVSPNTAKSPSRESR